VNRRRALEAFEGMMLGDAGLRMPRGGDNAFFDIAKSGRKLKIPTPKLLKYLRHVGRVLAQLGIESCDGHPKVFTRTDARGSSYDYCDLSTRTCSFLTGQYHRWYPCGVKEVPSSFALTPVSLAYWFMDDGSSSRDGVTVRAKLAANCFSLDSVQLLEAELGKLGLLTRREKYMNKGSGAGIRIVVRALSTDRLMEMVGPHIVIPYMYKIKYRSRSE